MRLNPLSVMVLALFVLGGCEKKNEIDSIQEAIDILLAEEEVDEESIFDKILRAANEGDVEAMAGMGEAYYFENQFVERNLTKAAEWWEKAANKGQSKAAYNVGIMYEKGEGVPQNKIKSAKYYKIAAEGGHVPAYLTNGYNHSWGKGVIKNDNEAFKWFKKASDEGIATAHYRLAHCYMDGQGVDQNTTKAVELHKQAVFKGEQRSVLCLEIYFREQKEHKSALVWNLIGCTIDGETIDLSPYREIYKLSQEEIDEATELAQQLFEKIKFE
jgi:TPR repeat protein